MGKGALFHTRSGAVRHELQAARTRDGDAERHDEALIGGVAREQWRNDALQTIRPLLARTDLPADLRPFLESLLRSLDSHHCLSKNQWEALQRIDTKARLLDTTRQTWDQVPFRPYKPKPRKPSRNELRPMWMSYPSLLPKTPPGRKEE